MVAMNEIERRKRYSREIHISRLVELLRTVKDDEISWHCPASIGFNAGKRFIFEDRFNIREDPVDSPECRTCKAFVGMPLDVEACPCDHLGYSEAIELTKKLLKEEGYID
jgi:hypothetical protein